MSQNLINVLAFVVGGIGVVFAFSAHRRITAARRSLLLLQGSFDGHTLVDAVAAYATEVTKIEQRLSDVGARQEELFALLGRSNRNLGVVRYDAFEDMGGKMSFSAALLDDHANGVVITSINARSESRAYAKLIVRGSSEHNLSKEEEAAISEALGRQKVRR